jgi:DNA mismatch repair protein MutL
VSDAPQRRPIVRLEPATVERIAAGEVVERPASVVKELVENALDAGARRVTVRCEGGGLERIEVADDGAGIPAEELGLAVERHATSKLAPAGSLEGIRTLGFRGEALASIGAVARLALWSRPAGAESAEGIRVHGGVVGERFTEARSFGTTVDVRDLFYNTPARRKFLRAPSAELVEVVRVLERAYLAHPTATFRLESGDREVAVFPSAAEPADAASRVLGPEFAAASFSVVGEVPGGSVEGLLGLPGTAAPTSTALYLAVNGRPVVARPLAQAIRLGFGDTIPRTRYPVGVVRLDLELDRVDINVHPTKREVRFVRERELADALRHRVRESLVHASGFRPGGAPPAPDRSVESAPAAPGTRSVPREPSLPSFVPTGVQRHLDLGGEVTRGTPVRRRQPFTLLGPVHALYWAAESPDGLVLIDQHAASERYLFERLKAKATLARQNLVEPVVLRLAAGEQAALEAFGTEVRDAGFEVEPFGPGVSRLVAVPSFRGRRARPELLLDLVRELADGGRPTVPDAQSDRALATIACHAAIRAGDVVDAPAFAHLLARLDELPSPVVSCPHGRPIWVELPRARLDRWFLREGT